MAWEKMTTHAAFQRSVAEALFARGVPLQKTVEILNLNRHTAENWHYLYKSRTSNVFSVFDKPSQRIFILSLLKRGYGYKFISKTFGLDLWLVRDTSRAFRKGLLDFEGGLYE